MENENAKPNEGIHVSSRTSVLTSTGPEEIGEQEEDAEDAGDKAGEGDVVRNEEVVRREKEPREEENEKEDDWKHGKLDRETEVLLATEIPSDHLVDAQVQVEAKDGDPGEGADEDKVEEVAEKAAHVVPRQSTGDRE